MEKGQLSPAETSDARGLVASLPRHWKRRSIPLQSVPFLPSRSEPPDLQGLHHSVREPPFPTPSACPQPSQRKTSCAGPEPRTRGQQNTSLQGPLPLCWSPQLKHPESSRVLEGSSISGLHRRPFPEGISPEIKPGKETRSFSSSSCLPKGKILHRAFPSHTDLCHQDTLPAKHAPSNARQAGGNQSLPPVEGQAGMALGSEWWAVGPDEVCGGGKD